MDWYQIPQKIKNWNADIDYVMFVDENGNGGRINNIFKKINNNISISDDEKYFTVTGCIFEKNNYSVIRNNKERKK